LSCRYRPTLSESLLIGFFQLYSDHREKCMGPADSSTVILHT
jgi:hypothetical protein